MRILASNRSRSQSRRQTTCSHAGFTLPELSITTLLLSIVMGGLAISLYTLARAFAGVYDISDMQSQDRLAALAFTRDVRQAMKVLSSTNNVLTLSNLTSGNITYTYDSTNLTWVRDQAGASSTLLKGCTNVTIALYQRPATNSAYNSYAAASTYDNCRVVQASWQSVRTRGKMSSLGDTFQTGKVEIRKH